MQLTFLTSHHVDVRVYIMVSMPRFSWQCTFRTHTHIHIQFTLCTFTCSYQASSTTMATNCAPTCRDAASSSEQEQCVGHCAPKRRRHVTWSDCLDEATLDLDRAYACFQLIENDPKLDYNLPKRGALAGQILKHCADVLDGHLAKKSPMIFKIGFTHCAHTRYYHTGYGYAKDRYNKWEGMVVIYASSQSFAAALVEASLIQRYMCSLVAI